MERKKTILFYKCNTSKIFYRWRNLTFVLKTKEPWNEVQLDVAL